MPYQAMFAALNDVVAGLVAGVPVVVGESAFLSRLSGRCRTEFEAAYRNAAEAFRNDLRNAVLLLAWITVANLSRLPGGRRATDVERLLSVLAAAEGLGLVSQGEVGNFSKFTAEE